MKLLYLGHSAFQLTSAQGIRLVIDPFVDNNPLAPIKAKDLKADYILLSHAHGDHCGDALRIAEKGKSTIIAVSELASYFSQSGHKTHPMQIGGAYDFEFGRVKLTRAEHGSMTPDGRYGGLAAGFVLTIDGICIYHAGDTGIFGDMKLIGELDRIDYFLVPIGGNYTMDIQDAAIATSWINPKYAIPMHYNTFPLIKADPEELRKALRDCETQVLVLKPGQEISI